MAKRKKSAPPTPVPSTSTSVEAVVLQGNEYSVGTEVQVKHRSFGRWVTLPIKEIRYEGDGYTFFFFHSPPGSIAVTSERIKPVKKTRKRKVVPSVED